MGVIGRIGVEIEYGNIDRNTKGDSILLFIYWHLYTKVWAVTRIRDPFNPYPKYWMRTKL